ncbi:hypothetical protein ABK040_016172 [Willaertia magna]
MLYANFLPATESLNFSLNSNDLEGVEAANQLWKAIYLNPNSPQNVLHLIQPENKNNTSHNTSTNNYNTSQNTQSNQSSTVTFKKPGPQRKTKKKRRGDRVYNKRSSIPLLVKQGLLHVGDKIVWKEYVGQIGAEGMLIYEDRTFEYAVRFAKALSGQSNTTGLADEIYVIHKDDPEKQIPYSQFKSEVYKQNPPGSSSSSPTKLKHTSTKDSAKGKKQKKDENVDSSKKAKSK